MNYKKNIQQILDLYKQGEGQVKIGKLIGSSARSIKKVLEQYKVTVRTPGLSSRRYNQFDNFFENIDSEKKAYWLGVLFADGSVSENKKGTTGRVVFSSTDRDWLEQFKIDLGYTGPIREEFHKKFKKSIWKITMDSRKMFEDLVDKGCKPRKSLTLEFPTKIPNSILHHFIRGFFDGDGSVSILRNKNNQNWTSICSSFCSGSKSFLDNLIQKIPTVTRTVYIRPRIYEIKLNKADSLSISEFMYNNATIYLERKYQKFVEFKKIYKPKGCSTTIISLPEKEEGIV